MKIFIDMDGVLVDWVSKFEDVFNIEYDDFKNMSTNIQNEIMSNMCYSVKTHYAVMEPIREMTRYLTEFIAHNPQFEYYILSSVGKHNSHSIMKQKRLWIKRFFPIMHPDNVEFVFRSKDKALFADSDCAIIDDFDLVRDLFEQRGGKSVDGSDIDKTKKFLEALANEHR